MPMLLPRLLLADNGPDELHTASERVALERLVDCGILEDFDIVSFRMLERESSSEHEWLERVRQRVDGFSPTVVIVRKLAGLKYDASSFVRLLRARAVRLVYEELDAWGLARKPLPREVLRVLRQFDVGVTCARGTQRELLRRAIGGPVHYRPHGVPIARLLDDATPALPERKVVMLSNFAPSRYRGASMPGTDQRRRLVRRLATRYGDDFAVFGDGWPAGSGALPRQPFERSLTVLRSADVSVGFDHFPLKPGYFSDRLPTAMYSGRPHVTNRHPGYPGVLPAGCGVISVVGGPASLARAVARLLALSPAERDELGSRARSFAEEHLSVERLYFDMISTVVR